jgi:hypothetical protein
MQRWDVQGDFFCLGKSGPPRDGRYWAVSDSFHVHRLRLGLKPPQFTTLLCHFLPQLHGPRTFHVALCLLVGVETKISLCYSTNSDYFEACSR